jgi:deferrochelatase/peroxidase EfeB
MAEAAVTDTAPLLSLAERGDIQGIVTSGFGHLLSAAFIFLQVTDPAGARRFVAGLVDGVATAAPWDHDDGGRKIRPDERLSIVFTYDGLRVLGLPELALSMLPVEFKAGMASRASVLGDWGRSDPSHWQLGGPNGPLIHALAILHKPDPVTLQARVAEIQAAAAASGLTVVAVEEGARDQRSHEQFGFAGDGLSEPDVAGIPSQPTPGQDTCPTGEFLLGYENALNAYPISPAVTEADDPKAILPVFPDGALPGYRDFGRNGTYFVYRKLEQDVAGFWDFLASACRQRYPEAATDPARLATAVRHLAAKVMGRWPSGVPTAVCPEVEDLAHSKDNDFSYLPDLDGMGCPVTAHIRRANPRDSLHRVDDTADESRTSVSQHRIIRRGIRFGDPLFDPSEFESSGAPLELAPDGRSRGLHFVAINADIQRQFEFIQQSWLNNAAFLGIFEGKDPVLGDNNGDFYATVPESPLRWRVGHVPRFVDVVGGAYFFLPSVTALRYLSSL